MSRTDERLWELKESAKWALSMDERKGAIRELARTYGPQAIESIAEIRDVSAYLEIRNACIEAIKQASAQSGARVARKAGKKKSRRTKKR